MSHSPHGGWHRVFLNVGGARLCAESEEAPAPWRKRLSGGEGLARQASVPTPQLRPTTGDGETQRGLGASILSQLAILKIISRVTPLCRYGSLAGSPKWDVRSDPESATLGNLILSSPQHCVVHYCSYFTCEDPVAQGSSRSRLGSIRTRVVIATSRPLTLTLLHNLARAFTLLCFIFSHPGW